MVLVTLDSLYQFLRWWQQHAEANWPLSDNCLGTRMLLCLCWGQSGGWSSPGGSLFTHPSLGQRTEEGGLDDPLSTGLCWSTSEALSPFPLTTVGRECPQHGATNRGHCPRVWGLPCRESYVCPSRWECEKMRCPSPRTQAKIVAQTCTSPCLPHRPQPGPQH